MLWKLILVTYNFYLDGSRRRHGSGSASDSGSDVVRKKRRAVGSDDDGEGGGGSDDNNGECVLAVLICALITLIIRNPEYTSDSHFLFKKDVFSMKKFDRDGFWPVFKVSILLAKEGDYQEK